MISRSLAQRLKRLEAHVMLADLQDERQRNSGGEAPRRK